MAHFGSVSSVHSRTTKRQRKEWRLTTAKTSHTQKATLSGSLSATSPQPSLFSVFFIVFNYTQFLCQRLHHEVRCQQGENRLKWCSAVHTVPRVASHAPAYSHSLSLLAICLSARTAVVYRPVCRH